MDRRRFCSARCRQIVKGERTIAATGVVEHVDTIEAEDAEVHGICTLHGANGTGQRIAHARQTQQFLRSPVERSPELRDDGSKDVGTQALVVAEQRGPCSFKS